jgi:hypothetical protein
LNILDYVVLFQQFCLTEGGSSVDPKVTGIDVSLKQGTVALQNCHKHISWHYAIYG